jgi:excisionase family DNA binding protein
MEKVLFDIKEVSARCGLSERTIYRMVDAQEFPAPRKCRSLNRWHIEDLRAWESGAANEA